MERDRSLDGLKFIMIFAVILIHQRCRMGSFNPNHILNMFAMPMFTILSGYFTKVKTWENYFQWVLKIAYLFFVFNFLHSIISVVVYDKDWVNSFFRGFVWPPFAMWYLVSLFCWRTMLQLLMRKGVTPGIRMLMGGGLVSLLVGFIPIGCQLSFQRTFAWLPFFLLGYMFRERDAISWIRRQTAWPFAVAMVVTMVFACFLPIYMPKAPYKDGLHDMMIRGAMMLDSFVLCMSLFRMIPVSFANRLSSLGALTMYFYLYHSLFMRVQYYYFEDEYGITLNLQEGLLLNVLYILVIVLMSRIKLFRWLLMEK